MLFAARALRCARGCIAHIKRFGFVSVTQSPYIVGMSTFPDTVNPPVVPAVAPTSAKYRVPSIHPEGRKFVAIAIGITVLLGFILKWEVAGWLMAGLSVWVAAFFRDPERTTPAGEGLIISPADGMVCAVAQVDVPRQLSGDGGLGSIPVTRVSVFMNVFDVHINRSPIAGKIRRIVYVPGKFFNADLDKASDDNERQYFIVAGADGTQVGFCQIAGLVARRIMRFVAEGDSVGAGERVGLIRFGSRVDVYLPEGYSSQVLAGQRCVAGETVLARRHAEPVLVGATQ
jgi:phosphatidylserine decarboxylase